MVLVLGVVRSRNGKTNKIPFLLSPKKMELKLFKHGKMRMRQKLTSTGLREMSKNLTLIDLKSLWNKLRISLILK
jgi:hypothetical protein